MTPQLAHNILLSHTTLDFLKNYGLITYGQSTNGIVTAYVHATHNNIYKIDNVPNGHQIQAYNVPMQSEEKDGVTQVIIPALNGLTLPLAGGPNLMITGQLSGCSFVYQPRNDGSLKVAHIQPARGRVPNASPHAVTGGTSLQMDIQNGGQFVGNNNAVEVFGSKYYQHQYGGQASRCTVVGVRRMNKWDLYAQIYTDQGSKVLNAVKFY